MAIITKRNVLTGIKVSEAMRRQVVSLNAGASLDGCIRKTIKYKVNAILAVDDKQKAVGVVSKTDLVGAYYAGLPLESPLETIMAGPPLFCRLEEPLEKALERMAEQRVHRLYVTDNDGDSVDGVLAYPDIVGLLYRYCRKCKRNIGFRGNGPGERSAGEYILAKEVMTPYVKAYHRDDALFTIMEGLCEYKFGAVLICDDQQKPVGVTSKTDLILAYRHRVSADAKVVIIMNSPVKTCSRNDPISGVIRKMIFTDVHRLFVREKDDHQIVGVISLTDAAKVRSGSCRACTSSRFLETGK